MPRKIDRSLFISSEIRYAQAHSPLFTRRERLTTSLYRNGMSCIDKNNVMETSPMYVGETLQTRGAHTLPDY